MTAPDKRSRLQAALWRRRLAATAAVLVLHAALFWVVASDWGAHRAPAMAPTMVVTLERPRPDQPEPPRPPPPPPQTAAAPASTVRTPAAAQPEAIAAAPAPVATPAPRPAAPAVGVPPSLALNVGCLGRSRERMTTAERKACDQEQANLRTPNQLRLPNRAPVTPLDREFAAAWAKRRANDPRPRAPRPRDCPLANITNCEPEDAYLSLFTSTGKGMAQTQLGRFVPPPPKDDRVPSLTKPSDSPKAPGVFRPAEIHDLPKPLP